MDLVPPIGFEKGPTQVEGHGKPIHHDGAELVLGRRALERHVEGHLGFPEHLEVGTLLGGCQPGHCHWLQIGGGVAQREVKVFGHNTPPSVAGVD